MSVEQKDRAAYARAIREVAKLAETIAQGWTIGTLCETEIDMARADAARAAELLHNCADLFQGDAP